MNVNKFKGKIVEKELTLGKLAKLMGIDRSTLYRKMADDGSTFTIKEVQLICRILDLTDQEAMSIFFSLTVA